MYIPKTFVVKTFTAEQKTSLTDEDHRIAEDRVKEDTMSHHEKQEAETTCHAEKGIAEWHAI